MNLENVKVVGDRYLVEMDDRFPKTELKLSASERYSDSVGTVRLHGHDPKDAKHATPAADAGVRVVIAEYGGRSFGEKYRIVERDDILLVGIE